VRDRYDELVFVCPPEDFHAMLQAHTPREGPESELSSCGAWAMRACDALLCPSRVCVRADTRVCVSCLVQ
jgi:hypothetical protein